MLAVDHPAWAKRQRPSVCDRDRVRAANAVDGLGEGGRRGPLSEHQRSRPHRRSADRCAGDTDGTIDFFCCPRFDSPSVFCSLLDADKGGYFRIAPAGGSYVTKQLYLPSTAILLTRFMTPDGVGEVQDFMPVIESRSLRPAQSTALWAVALLTLERRPRGLSGEMRRPIRESDDTRRHDEQTHYLGGDSGGATGDLLVQPD